VDVCVCAGGCVDVWMYVCLQVDVCISSNKLSIGFSYYWGGYSNEFKYIHLHLCCTTLASNPDTH